MIVDANVAMMNVFCAHVSVSAGAKDHPHPHPHHHSLVPVAAILTLRFFSSIILE